MSKSNMYNNRRIHVCKVMCSTCIFRSNSVIDRARVKEMIKSSDKNSGAIVCHHTLDQKQKAVCRGYFECGQSFALKLGRKTPDIFRYVNPDNTEEGEND